MRLSFLNPLNIGKPPKKCQKTSHIVRNMGGQQIFCVNLKKVVIFSYLELKNGRFWSLIGLRSMDLSLGRKGT